MKMTFSRFGSLFLLVSWVAAPSVRAVDSSSPAEFAGSSPIKWSVRMADSEISRLGDSLEYKPDNKAKWDYTTGLFTLALVKLNQQVNNPRYVKFAEDTIGSFIAPDGTIHRYKVADLSLDNINPGKTLLALWQLTHEARYRNAAGLLREQLNMQPRTSDGGFWHKKRYPNQMWLDGLYMAEPFYAEYAKLFHERPSTFYDIAKQIELVGEHTYDPNTGLFYHGWDESKKQAWANPTTGTSSNFWGRAIGWYAMALVDTLDYFPTNNPARPQIIAMLQKLCAGVAKWQDPESGLWYQVLDQGMREGNYLEATASSMFVYAMAKGVNHGYLSRDYIPILLKGYRSIINRLIKVDKNGNVTLTHCCSVAGLGYGRDGSFHYYISEPVVDNDLKGVGPFILAGIEVQHLLNSSPEPSTIVKPAGSAASDITPQSVLDVMQRVADWQLAHPSKHKPVDWTQGAGAAGMMALAGISGDPKYRNAMYAMGESNHWELGPRKYVADDHCIGQTYAELYFLYREPKMIAPMRNCFDSILAKPSGERSLDFSQPYNKAIQQWSWCDSLFMGPPTWVRLYAATGDPRYLNFAVSNWWRTTDYLYDTNEHLYFRDSTYFKKREANGKKIFWSRGNGWVMAGLVRVLQYMPMNSPDRSPFEKLFKDMADKILTCQQPDGLWRSSLLDPESYPLKETSGSGFYTYALAWGVNQGLLDRTKFEPVVRKAWEALVTCVNADGKLTHVQPIGADPKKFNPESTEVYGVGAFLLAGSEVYRTAVLESATPVAVKVSNPADFRRDCETVELDRDFLRISRLTKQPSWVVMDGVSSRILASQAYSAEMSSTPDRLLFQVDLAPHESRTFYILEASALAAVPPAIIKTFARYVPERHDDFAWESDRIAHRMFGKALEAWPAEPLTSSGVDVWIKRTRRLIINEMYATGDYYNTNGLAQDDYKVGKTRGDGGLGIWEDGRLYVSKNWCTYKVITTGPIRSEFELTYDAWDADGRKVSETKRISIDAGSNMSRVESTFSSDDQSPLEIGVGLAERPGLNVVIPVGKKMLDARSVINPWRTSTEDGLVVQDQSDGWMTYWQPQDFNKGTTALAIVLPKGSVEAFTNDMPNLPASTFAPPTHTQEEGQPAIRDLLAIAPAEVGKPFVYYLGAGWDQSGDFPDAKSWTDYVRRFAERHDQPLRISIGN